MRRRCLGLVLALVLVLVGNGCGRGEDRPGQVTSDSKKPSAQSGMEK